MRGVGGLLNLCQGGTCICDHQQNNVLYCYGEVVLKKPHLRDGDTSPPSLLEHLYPVQLAQLVTVTLLLLFMLLILLSIRSTLTSLKHQVKRISRLMTVPPSAPASLHGTFDREKAVHLNGNGRIGNGTCVIEREHDQTSIMSSFRGSVTI